MVTGLNLSSLLSFRAPTLEPSSYIRLRLVSEWFLPATVH